MTRKDSSDYACDGCSREQVTEWGALPLGWVTIAGYVQDTMHICEECWAHCRPHRILAAAISAAARKRVVGR